MTAAAKMTGRMVGNIMAGDITGAATVVTAGTTAGKVVTKGESSATTPTAFMIPPVMEIGSDAMTGTPGSATTTGSIPPPSTPPPVSPVLLQTGAESCRG